MRTICLYLTCFSSPEGINVCCFVHVKLYTDSTTMDHIRVICNLWMHEWLYIVFYGLLYSTLKPKSLLYTIFLMIPHFKYLNIFSTKSFFFRLTKDAKVLQSEIISTVQALCLKRNMARFSMSAFNIWQFPTLNSAQTQNIIVIIKHVTMDYGTFSDISICCECDAFIIFNKPNTSSSHRVSPPAKSTWNRAHSRSLTSIQPWL